MVNKSTITTAQLLNLYDITYVYLPCLVWKKKENRKKENRNLTIELGGSCAKVELVALISENMSPP